MVHRVLLEDLGGRKLRLDQVLLQTLTDATPRFGDLLDLLKLVLIAIENRQCLRVIATANRSIHLGLDAAYLRVGLLMRIPSSSCATWKPRSCTSRRFHCRFSTAVVKRLMLRGFCIILAAIS